MDTGTRKVQVIKWVLIAFIVVIVLWLLNLAFFCLIRLQKANSYNFSFIEDNCH